MIYLLQECYTKTDSSKGCGASRFSAVGQSECKVTPFCSKLLVRSKGRDWLMNLGP